MESVSSRLLSPAVSKFSETYSIRAVRTRVKRAYLRKFPLIVKCKSSSYQDFQGYARPSRLLPSTEVKVCTDVPLEKDVDNISYQDLESTYKVRLRTSNVYGSGLSDLNSGILLCLIDENGSSILQRLPATLTWKHKCSQSNDSLHFQRGSSDEFTFKGPKLRRIIAVWIGLESGCFTFAIVGILMVLLDIKRHCYDSLLLHMLGQWRMGDISLTVLSHPLQNPSSADNCSEIAPPASLHYNFENDDILLGEKSEASMVELRPHSVTSFAEDKSSLLDEKSLNTSNEESMKEYTDLKLSLLLYDVMLVLGGSAVAFLSPEDNATYVFLAGGLSGFIYLLLVQISVDGLSAPELIPSENKANIANIAQIFERLKGPVFGLILASAFTFLTLKYVSPDGGVKLTSQDVIIGMMGFLMCKVAVVLAAARPIPLSFKDNEQSS